MIETRRPDGIWRGERRLSRGSDIRVSTAVITLFVRKILIYLFYCRWLNVGRTRRTQSMCGPVQFRKRFGKKEKTKLVTLFQKEEFSSFRTSSRDFQTPSRAASRVAFAYGAWKSANPCRATTANGLLPARRQAQVYDDLSPQLCSPTSTGSFGRI